MTRRKTAASCIILIVVALGGTIIGKGSGRKFYADDPLPIDPEHADASRITPQEAGPSYIGAQLIHSTADRAWRRAGNVNTIDEVPDSSWFTNRIGSAELSLGAIRRGPNSLAEDPHGPWTVVGGKSDGVTPGLQLADSTGERYFVKFDPPSNPEMASAAEMVSTKILHALGYHVPENYIATLRRDDMTIGAGATFKEPGGLKHPLTFRDIDRVLAQAARRPDNAYRILASRAVAGVPVGPFKYEGTRADDPNDVVPHEHRRELRGLRVFAAWLNHVDTKAQNSLDTVVVSGSRAVVRHRLIDFGSTLGSAGVKPMDWRDGYQSVFDGRTAAWALASFGLHVPSWARISYPDLPSVGRIEGKRFRPERWNPTLPNPAFENARPDDTFWAARRVMAFSDEALAAIVQTAELSDPRAVDYLTGVLISRRNAIGRAWLTGLNPVVKPLVTADGMMVFANAAVDAGIANEPPDYIARWAVFDNATGATMALGASERCAGRQCALPASVPHETEYPRAEIRSIHETYPVWRTPVHVFLRRDHNGWSPVGLERLVEDPSRGDIKPVNRRSHLASHDAGE